jgi:tetratricopeptide (TPR) repeat protein
MQSDTHLTDLWYPFPRPLKLFVEVPSRGSEKMKRLWWSVAVCVGIALTALTYQESRLESAAGRAEREIREVRFIQPRLTVEQVYARCEPRAEADGTVSDVWCSTPPGVGDNLRRSSSGDVRREAPSRGESQTRVLHLDGVTQLISSQSRESLDQAVRRLESGVRRRPDDARALSDLATAYFVRGQQNENLYDLVLALSTVDKAARANNRLPEALFNRALFLQEMSLHTEARLAWDQYLRLEKDPDWSAEAQARRQSLEKVSADQIWMQQQQRLGEAVLQGDMGTAEKIVTQLRQPAQKYAAEQILGQWGEAVLAKDFDRADRFLRIARVIGDALRQSGAITIPNRSWPLSRRKRKRWPRSAARKRRSECWRSPPDRLS